MIRNVVAVAALLAGGAWAAEARAQGGCEKQSSCCNDGADARPWVGAAGGVRWEWSMLKARRQAAREGKPILLYQLVGDLDKEGC
jgi:hypothetical protein